MPLPSYESFKQLKKDRLNAELKKKNKCHHEFAEAFYVLIEKDLALGYDYFNTGEIPLETPYDDNWYYILSNKCKAEGWITSPSSPYSKYNFTLKHKKDHRWLTRLIKGWN